MLVSRQIITHSAFVARILRVAEIAAQRAVPVVIGGETGVGKELLARFIHESSPRKDKPFVAINCAAIPRDLLESELFGYERGAFTGATMRKLGKFEQANGGTLLLDEIGEMETVLQAKLLRVLQERELDRLGGSSPVPLDVRIIATTNRNLRQMVDNGTFRADLYYRMNVLLLTIPPLRERRDDIIPLVEHVVGQFSARPLSLSPEASIMLRQHPWPGNVRELENVIHRAVLLCAGDVIEGQDIQLELVPEEFRALGSLAGLTLAEVERRLVEDTLIATGGNRIAAAKMMAIGERTIRNKLAIYGGDRDDGR